MLLNSKPLNIQFTHHHQLQIRRLQNLLLLPPKNNRIPFQKCMIQSVFTAEPKHHGTEHRGIHVVSTKLWVSENVLDL